MLKINPIFTDKFTENKGIQARTPEFFVSVPKFKPTLKTDIFQYQNEREIRKNAYDLPFLGKKQNRYEQGKEIAANLQKLLNDKAGALSDEKFKKEFSKINDKNIIPTINEYNKISPEETLIGAICTERANSTKTRNSVIASITDKLVKIGDNVGVQTEHYKKYFDKELKSQFSSLLPVKVEQLNKVSGALVQAIENKNSLSRQDKEDLKNANIKDTQSYTTSVLKTSVKKAEDSMQEQADYDGWSAKLGEQIRKLWKSENQKELVHKDIKSFESQVKELDKLVGTSDYNKKFKEVFEVEFDSELIAVYKQKEEKYIAASICSTVEDNFKNSVKDLLSGKSLDVTYAPYNPRMGGSSVVIRTKQQNYDKNLNAFAEFVGKGNVEEGKKQIEKTMKDYKIKPESTLDEKYNVLQKMANKYAKRLTQNTKNALGKKDLSEMKREYDNSYYAAFGVKNDIAKRVTDYRNSQMLSELLVQDTILCSASIPIWMCTAGTGLIPTMKIAAMHSAADIAVYGSDRLSSKQGMTAEDFKDMMKWAAVDGATAFANQLSYKGIEAITSPIAKMSGKAAAITDFALCTAADVAVDSGMEYLATGKVTLQGVVYSVVFSAGGYIIDMKVDDYQRKSL